MLNSDDMKLASHFIECKSDADYLLTPEFDVLVLSSVGQLNNVTCCVCFLHRTTMPLEMVANIDVDDKAACGHVICKECFVHYVDSIPYHLCVETEQYVRTVRCPVCKTVVLETLTRGYRLVAELKTHRLVVKCKNFNIGCGWTGSYGDYLNHHDGCQVPCPFKIIGCRNQCTKEQLQAHLLVHAETRGVLKLVVTADAVRQERDAACLERDAARQELDSACKERDAARQERDSACKERDDAREERDDARQERDDALDEHAREIDELWRRIMRDDRRIKELETSLGIRRPQNVELEAASDTEVDDASQDPDVTPPREAPASDEGLRRSKRRRR